MDGRWRPEENMVRETVKDKGKGTNGRQKYIKMGVSGC